MQYCNSDARYRLATKEQVANSHAEDRLQGLTTQHIQQLNLFFCASRRWSLRGRGWGTARGCLSAGKDSERTRRSTRGFFRVAAPRQALLAGSAGISELAKQLKQRQRCVEALGSRGDVRLRR
jgi:hypothetical protein